MNIKINGKIIFWLTPAMGIITCLLAVFGSSKNPAHFILVAVLSFLTGGLAIIAIKLRLSKIFYIYLIWFIAGFLFLISAF